MSTTGVIPKASPGPRQFGERYFTTKGLTWKQQTELKDELVGQGCLVQEIYLADPMNVLIERHAANLISRTFRHGTERPANMNAGDLEVINFAYQQLLRGANTLRSAQEQAWDEGYDVGEDWGSWAEAPVRQEPAKANPYRSAT